MESDTHYTADTSCIHFRDSPSTEAPEMPLLLQRHEAGYFPRSAHLPSLLRAVGRLPRLDF